jgi:Protein of unknown function (DUF1275)
VTSSSTGTVASAQARPHGLLRSLVADPGFGPLPGLLLVLTVVTGVVDAISILALGRVFVANMTGNVVFAGFAIVGAPGARADRPASCCYRARRLPHGPMFWPCVPPGQ